MAPLNPSETHTHWKISSMNPIKVRISGAEYEVSTVNELALFPLLRVFGSDVAPTDESSKEYKKWQQKFLSRFADPINQASVAYSLSSLIPGLPESAVKYALYKEESGDRREDFVLNISAMDLLALVMDLTPLLKARQAEIEGATPQIKARAEALQKGSKGFGEKYDVSELMAIEKAATAEIKAHEIAEQRRQLQAEFAANLAALDTASEG